MRPELFLGLVGLCVWALLIGTALAVAHALWF